MEEDSNVISDQDIEGLIKYAKFRSAFKVPTASKIGSIVFGLIELLLGLANITISPIFIIFIVIGVAFLVGGVWLMISTKSWGLLMSGIMIVAFGAINVLVTLVNGGITGKINNVLLGYSIIPLVWGVFTIIRFVNNEKSMIPLTKSENEYYKKIAASLYALTPSEYTDMFTFDASQLWTGTFSGDTVICMSSKNDITLIPRDKFCFIVGKKSGDGESKATMVIGQQRIKGYISDSSLENYEAWISEDKSSVTT